MCIISVISGRKNVITIEPLVPVTSGRDLLLCQFTKRVIELAVMIFVRVSTFIDAQKAKRFRGSLRKSRMTFLNVDKRSISYLVETRLLFSGSLSKWDSAVVPFRAWFGSHFLWPKPH